MREQQNNSLPRAGYLGNDVLHRDRTGRRGRVKIIFIHRALRRDTLLWQDAAGKFTWAGRRMFVGWLRP